MKRILIFLVVLLPFLAKSQTVITGKYKYTDSLTFAKYKNNSTLDSVLSVDQNGRLRLSSKSPLDTTSLSNRIDARVKYTDTANMLIPYLRKLDTTGKWLSVGYLPYLVKYSDTAAFLSAYYNKTAIDARLALKLNISDTSNMLSPYVRTSNLPSLAPYVKYTDTASMLSNYYNKTATDSKLALKLNISDTANMLSPYARTLALGGYVPYIGATKDVNIGTKNYYGNAFFDGFTSVAASGTLITLTVSSTPSYLITGSGGQTIKLPDATTLPNGAIYVFNNNQSSGAINVNNNSNTLVKSVPSGGYLNLELIDNSTAAGSWDAHFQAPSNVSWSTNTFDYPGSITSATWNGNTIAINRGGTGASTSGGALTNLGAQPQLNGTGFVKASGTTISYDNSTYLTSADIAGKVNYTDTATMLSPYSRDYNTVHKAGTEVISGYKSLNNTLSVAGGILFATNSILAQGGGLSGNPTGFAWYNSGSSGGVVSFPTDSLRSYLFPSKTGTVALTSDLGSYVNAAGYGLSKSGQTILADTSVLVNKAGTQIISGFKYFNGGLYSQFMQTASPTIMYYQDGNINQGASAGTIGLTENNFYLSFSHTSSVTKQTLNFPPANSRTYFFPDATGTLALTSDIPSITGKLNISDTAAMLSGYKTYYPRAALSFTAGSGAYNNSTGVITIPTNTNQLTNGAGFISSYTETDPVVKAINGIVKSNGTTISAASAGTDYVSPSGLTTALSSYLPLSGGTLTGNLKINSNTIGTADNADRTLILGSRPSSATTVSLGFDAGGTYRGDIDFNSTTGDFGYWFYNGTSYSNYFKLASTGAATFLATTNRITLANNFNVTGNTNSPKLSFFSFGDIATYAVTGPSIQKINTGSYGEGRLAFFQHQGIDFTNETEVFSIAATGAATFSNLVKGKYFNVTGTNGLSGYLIQSGDWEGNASTDLAVSSESANLRFYTNGSPTERMRIGSDGTKYFGSYNGSRWQMSGDGQNFYNYVNGYYIYGIWNSSNSMAIESAFGGDILFKTQNQGTSSSPQTAPERMRITSGGNLLVGNVTDDGSGSKLQVSGNIQSTVSGGDAILWAKNGTVSTYMVSNTTGGSYGLVGTATNHDFVIRTNNTNRLTITAAGVASFSNTITTGGQTWKINNASSGSVLSSSGGNILSITINGTTYYIPIYTGLN